MSQICKPSPMNCETCKLRTENSFCNLPREASIQLQSVKSTRIFSQGERLFSEAKPVDEVMIVCAGAAALTFSSVKGKALMLDVSEHGEVLGLSSAISGQPYEVSAEALERTQVAAISRADFLGFLDRFPAASINAGTELSRKVNRAYGKIRLVGLGLSVPQRVAAWLLHLQESHRDGDNVITLPLTHERIAQLLGVSRESVTRALADLKKREVIEIHGIHFHLRNPAYLSALLGKPGSKASKALSIAL